MFYDRDFSIARNEKCRTSSRWAWAGVLCLFGLSASGCFDEADEVPPAGCDAISVSDLFAAPDAPVAESDFELRWQLSAVCDEFVSFAGAEEPSSVRVNLSGDGLSEPGEWVEPFPYDDIEQCTGNGAIPNSILASQVVENLGAIGPGQYEATVTIDGMLCEESLESVSIDFDVQPVGSCPGTATDTLDLQISDLAYDMEAQEIRWTVTYAAQFEPGPMANPGPEVTPILEVSIANPMTGIVLASSTEVAPEMLPLDSIDQQVPLQEVGLPMPPQPGAIAEIRVSLASEGVLQCGVQGLELNDEAVIQAALN